MILILHLFSAHFPYSEVSGGVLNKVATGMPNVVTRQTGVPIKEGGSTGVLHKLAFLGHSWAPGCWGINNCLKILFAHCQNHNQGH